MATFYKNVTAQASGDGKMSFDAESKAAQRSRTRPKTPVGGSIHGQCG